MAKKLIELTARDIILQANAETIREAYEARLKIDELLVKRAEAYRQIEAIELQVEETMGEEGVFVYPEPPVVVAGFSKPAPAARPAPPKPKPEPVIEEEEAEVVDAEKEIEPVDSEEAPAEEPAEEVEEK
jgi:hypothetical protein